MEISHHSPARGAKRSSAYALVLRLGSRVALEVGALRTLEFQPGTYFYAGSGKRNIEARIERHLQAHKPVRWHIDYLTTNPSFLTIAAVIAPPDLDECRVSRFLSEHFEPTPKRFGATDCPCGCVSHLYFSPASLGRRDIEVLFSGWRFFEVHHKYCSQTPFAEHSTVSLHGPPPVTIARGPTRKT